MGDRSRSIRRSQDGDERDSGGMGKWQFVLFLFPIFAVVVDFFFGCHCQHFLKPVHFFIIPFSSSSSSSIACFRRRTFHEPNRERANYLDGLN